METDIDTGAIVACALRYCLGRRTYMPSLVIDWVKRHYHATCFNDPNVIHLIRRDLKEAIDSGRDLGDACDIETWLSFDKWLEENTKN